LTRNDSACATSSSPNSGNLRIDFYESGRGDTIVVTFPDGGLGVVDAHPSPSKSRPGILEIIGERALHFVCLTHPRADHGVDLVPLLRAPQKPDQFWHTTSDINPFVYRLGEAVNFPSDQSGRAREMAEGWANFHIDIWGAVVERDIPQRRLRAGLEPVTIDGVDVHVLSPEEHIHDRFFKYWMQKARDPRIEPPDRNALSAILALRFGESVVLLGADALQENWRDAAKRYRKHELPKAIVLKVPHHGARNAIDLNPYSKKPTYFDLCRHDADLKCHAVLFAGDSRHPDPKVQEKLKARTRLFCLSNGIASAPTVANPLGIEIEGARAVRRNIPVCNPVVSFEILKAGEVKVLAGGSCEECPHLKS
jgi:hypothetical protein